jgi:hypothetical protein
MRIAVLLFLIFFSTGVSSNENCTNDKEFCFYLISLDRDEASNFCHDKEYKLASIENKNKENKILSLVPKGNRYWLDGKYSKNDNSLWKWKAGEIFTYSNWGAGEPNNLESGESYLLLDLTEKKAFWNDNRNDGHTQKKQGIYIICQEIRQKSRNSKNTLTISNNFNFSYYLNNLLYFIILFPLFWFLLGLFYRKKDVGLTRLAERNIHINKKILIMLSWDNKNDLDLHVVCPNGEVISYETLGRYVCGGMLDVDANGTYLRNDPIEKIGWDKNPTVNGTYKIFVNYYEHHDLYEIKTKFRIETIIFSKKNKFTGVILPEDEMIKIFEFTIN